MAHDHDHDHDGGDSDEHGHDHAGDPDDLKARARGLQSLLLEKDLVSVEAVNEVLELFETEVGPMNGARVVARAWTDPEFKRRLLSDANDAVAEFDFEIGQQHLSVVENTPETHNAVVCTLCSCYPWSLLGLPPTWYKSPQYRSRIVREPRAVLSEFGVDLDDSTEVQVWDSSSEIRYMVLPQRPPDADGLDEDELVERVTRDSMIGVERLGSEER
jgi:nitrile hydratase